MAFIFHHGHCTVENAKAIQIVGHHHPAGVVRDGAGLRLKLPALVQQARCWIMPAFSPWASGTEWPREAQNRIWLCSPQRILRLEQPDEFLPAPYPLPQGEEEPAVGFSLEHFRVSPFSLRGRLGMRASKIGAPTAQRPQARWKEVVPKASGGTTSGNALGLAFHPDEQRREAEVDRPLEDDANCNSQAAHNSTAYPERNSRRRASGR
jgi:hypothetical protein